MIQKIFKRLEIISLLSFVFSSLFLFLIFHDWSLVNKLIIIPISFIFSEIIIRTILYIIYGEKYFYKIFPFYIINDKKCGYRFKRDIKSENIEFPIFERYAFPPKVSPSRRTKVNKFQRVKFSTNKFGLRENSNFNNLNEKNKIKIICSGGSTTAGQSINNFETWPSKLEESLNDKGINCKVYNAGMYGYDSYNELMNIKNHLLDLKPDILILHQGWNEEFAYSVSGDEKKYKPKQPKKYLEKNFFYSNNINFFPKKSIIAVILFKALRVQYLFKWEKGRMNFRNMNRWLNLTNDIYIKNWFDNLIEIKKICIKNNIKLFLLDYPCLVNISDDKKSREIYIKRSRLTEEHAIYQSFSKSRIEELFRLIENNFDILDVKKSFKYLSGNNRLNYFTDEIHLSAKGEELLGKELAKEIMNYFSFNSNYTSALPIIKESRISSSEIKKLRLQCGRNSTMLGIFIRKYIYRKKDLISNDKKIVIPTDIYTTT